MEEVTKEEFERVILKVSYTTSFLLGEKDTIRYNGKKGLFKNSCFAKKVNDKYYVNRWLKK